MLFRLAPLGARGDLAGICPNGTFRDRLSSPFILARSSPAVPGRFYLAKLLKTIHPSIFPVRFFALRKLPHRGEKGVDLKGKDQFR